MTRGADRHLEENGVLTPLQDNDLTYLDLYLTNHWDLKHPGKVLDPAAVKDLLYLHRMRTEACLGHELIVTNGLQSTRLTNAKKNCATEMSKICLS